jgi:putative ABC transport system permease protein
MYPELRLPLLLGVAACGAVLAWVSVRYAFLRKLAARQLRRRRTEALLVIAGSLLGTTMIVASLIVGDTLDHSVRGVAYRTLGPVDERVTSLDPAVGAEAARRLAPLAGDPRVDGVLTVTTTQGAALRHASTGDFAEPRTVIVEADFAAASRFGGGDTGLSGATPARGEVVVNADLADTLDLVAGDEVTLYPFAVPTRVRVARVVPVRGLAGFGSGETNRDVFVAPGTLADAARAAGRGAPTWHTLVSNRGGVEAGASLSDAIAGRIGELLAGAPPGASVEKPKAQVLRQAEQTGAVLGSVFLFISSFSIIAGILLLVNVFVMLAEERKSEIGMLRAIGLRRARLVGALVVEGSAYGVVAAVLGVGTGIAVARGVVVVAARVFRSYGSGSGLTHMEFAFRPTSLVNGAAMGFLIAFVTVAVASARISRTNVIAAIRDLPAAGVRAMRRRTRVLCALGVVFFGAAAVPAVADSTGPMTYALPALSLVCAVPLLARRLPKRAVYNGSALLVLLWALFANMVRPDVFDNPTTTTYTILGSMLAFAAVVLISENQRLVLWPFHRLVERPSEAGLAARLAVAYPTAKRFRTGATLAMYALVIFTLVLLTEINGIMRAGISSAVRDSAGRYTVRADFAVPPADGDLARAVRATGGDVTAVTPVRVVTATSDDPGGRWTTPLPIAAVGVTPTLAADSLPLDSRMPAYADDAAVWRAVATDPALVVVDLFFGATGGPAGQAFGPGATLTITDPRTGKAVPRTVAGLMKTGQAFWGMAPSFTYPVLMADSAVRTQFGASAAVPSAAFLALRGGVDPQAYTARLQASLIASGVSATDLEHTVRQNFAANESFFQLMQGFLALGLLVGITGLGVVMVRAVRERRRTIGVLRALGFRARTVRRSFLAESALIAAEGIGSGAVLAVVTSWLLFNNSAAFRGLESTFPIAWLQIGGVVVATFGASMLATLGPANRAARIKPALALRISD